MISLPNGASSILGLRTYRSAITRIQSTLNNQLTPSLPIAVLGERYQGERQVSQGAKSRSQRQNSRVLRSVASLRRLEAEVPKLLILLGLQGVGSGLLLFHFGDGPNPVHSRLGVGHLIARSEAADG